MSRFPNNFTSPRRQNPEFTKNFYPYYDPGGYGLRIYKPQFNREKQKKRGIISKTNNRQHNYSNIKPSLSSGKQIKKRASRKASKKRRRKNPKCLINVYKRLPGDKLSLTLHFYNIFLISVGALTSYWGCGDLAKSCPKLINPGNESRLKEAFYMFIAADILSVCGALLDLYRSMLKSGTKSRRRFIDMALLSVDALILALLIAAVILFFLSYVESMWSFGLGGVICGIGVSLALAAIPKL